MSLTSCSQSLKPSRGVYTLPCVPFKHQTLFLPKLPISFLLGVSSSNLLLCSYYHRAIPETDPWSLHAFGLDWHLPDSPALVSSSHGHPSPATAELRSVMVNPPLLYYILDLLAGAPFGMTNRPSTMLTDSL